MAGAGRKLDFEKNCVYLKSSSKMLHHVALVCAVSMSIEKYFKRSQEKILPSPHGSLSLSVPSRAIAAANKEVGRVLRQQSSASATTISKKRGKYNKYSPEER